MRRAHLSLILVLVGGSALGAPLAGCSIWNQPKRGLLDGGPGRDAPPIDAPEPDGGLDGGLDGGPDSPDAGPPRFEGLCGDGLDDDLDGFTDCDDIDCASDVMFCCDRGVPILDETWAVAALTGWSRLPQGGDGPNAPSAGAPLSRFSSGNTAYPRALIYDPVGSATGCVAIDPGVTIRTTFSLLADTVMSCTSCDERAGILLTAVQPATAVTSYMNGDVLPDELGVRMVRETGTPTSAAIEVSVAGTVVGPRVSGVHFSDTVTVEIVLTPGIEAGVPVSFASVTVVVDGTSTTVLDRHPALARETLLGPSSGCHEGRGLYLAVEGVGNRIGIGNLEVDAEVCPNPNHFRDVGGPLDATDLGATAWSAGGAGAPSLVYSDENPAAPVAPRWDLLFDASDRNRANETFATVRFAVGGAIFSDDEWTALTPRRTGAPLVHELFPTCGGTCTDSNREPDLWVDVDEEREVVGLGTGLVVWARRTSTAWEIRRDTLGLIADDTIGGDALLLTTAAGAGTASVTACTALRSPALLERPGGFWLVFVCEHGGPPPDVRVATLDTLGALVSIGDAPILQAGDAPLYARLGIQDVDGETWIRSPGTADQEVLVRLWFVSRSGGLPVVGIAEGVASGMTDAFPDVSMFAGNPVLASGDESLPECDGVCRITSVATTRTADTRDVRVVVALTDEATAATRHLLVPLEQTLPIRR